MKSINIIAVMQPYIFPHLEYFQLIHATDMFVIFDDVCFMKRSYITRNKIAVKNAAYRFSVPVMSASQNKLIKDLKVNPDLSLLKTLKHSYSKAPHFNTVFPLLQAVMLYPDDNLARFVTNSLQVVCRYLEIDTQFCYSSQIPLIVTGRDKIIPLCHHFSAGTYVNKEGGVMIYDSKTFEKEHILLRFVKSKVTYERVNGFIPNLSIIDMLMFNSVDQIQQHLKKYQLLSKDELLRDNETL